MEKTISAFADIKRIGSLSNDGVFIYDIAHQQFLYLNKPFCKIVRAPEKKLLQSSRLAIKFLASEDLDYLEKRYEDLLHSGCITSTEFRLHYSNDTISHLDGDVYLLDNKKIMVGFIKDVTNAKQHEDFIVDYGARKDTLLDMITHNLSGPLYLSKNILVSVHKKYKDRKIKDISPEINLILESTEQCIEIVDDFLKEEHQESAHIFVKKTRFDVLDRIKATLEKLKITNPGKKFRLVSKLQTLNISTDSVKFFQVIHNVLSNAIKFTPEDGRIDIIVEEQQKYFIIRIKDNGIGIPTKHHPILFNKRTASRRVGLKGEKSSGIGLSIAKRLVELIGGTIWFKSRENKGSEFFIKIPKE